MRCSVNEPEFKTMYSHYISQAVDVQGGDLDPLTATAKELGIRVIVGVAEKVNYSVYCSAVHINPKGKIENVHRKLMPTFGERLVWSIGDGYGLKAIKAENNFKISTLNCWENWLPLARASLYGQGINLHVALWPGLGNVEITRFIAKEGRTFVISVGGTLMLDDIKSENTPCAEKIKGDGKHFAENEVIFDGGTCIAGPDGEWIVSPLHASRYC